MPMSGGRRRWHACQVTGWGGMHLFAYPLECRELGLAYEADVLA
jgi:hypothetical protein